MERQRSPKRNTRKLRDRKERKFYTDDWVGEADDEIEGPQSFDLEEKLETPRFTKLLIKEMRGQDFNLAYIQQHGFTTPLLFKDKAGLGIRIPGPTFCVGDVKTCVGSKRLLDVMDVRTQKNFELTMKQWQEYYDNPERDRLLNVISLEFSHTKLENYVESPTVVRQLDWVDRVWPRHLKNLQTESTNVMDEMMYPKVQKYCLMSVKGCFTDFHVDFGGTSVWYHILKGAKVFWLIPPTDKNLDLYQAWVLSGKQGDTFFGDNVDECGRVFLQDGDTFFIPSGWIHAVYTPADSLVFGGNFLHSFGIDKQLKIASVEEATKVPQKFRYPFFTEMLWYTLERYVHCLLGRTYIRIPDEDEANAENATIEPQPPVQKLVPERVHLSPQELLGLKAIVMYLHQLPIARKNVPALIYDPVALLREIRTIVEEHRYDILEKAVTGRPILVWPGERAEDVGKVQDTKRKRHYKVALPSSANIKEGGGWCNSPPSSLEEEPQRKRVKCGRCQSCLTKEDCKSCFRCLSTKKPKDKVNTKGCVMRECLMPLLPYEASCNECGLDGWGETPTPTQPIPPLKARVSQSSLMECISCSQITHPICVANKLSKTVGVVNDDLPNSWECPCCIDKNKPVRAKKSKSSDERRTSTESNSNDVSGGSLLVTSSSVKVNEFPLAAVSSSSVHSKSGSSTSIMKPADDKHEITVKTEKESPGLKIKIPVVDTVKHKQISDKKMREDEKAVQQKMALAVRRKSLEEGLAKFTKSKSTSDPLKLKLYALTPDSSASRRKSDDATKLENKVIATPEIKVEEKAKETITPKKEPKVESGSDDEGGETNEASTKKVSPIKYPFRTELSNKIMNGSAKSLKRPCNVVRPAAIHLDEDGHEKDGRKRKKFDHLKDPTTMLNIFKWLNIVSLNRSLQVCKDWNRIIMTPSLWLRIDLSHHKVTPDLLKGVVRRQPISVSLNWTTVSKQQLFWFISRLPQLKELSLQGVPWTSVVALKTCMCPTLVSLDLGYVGGLTDAALREILAPPVDSRPGLTDTKSRLRHLKSLNLAGASLSDVALRYVTQHAGSISKLELSTCSRITDAGIAQLGAPDSPSLENLTHLNISGSPQLTNISLDHLRRCRNLKYLDIRNIPGITIAGLTKFLSLVNNPVNGVKVIVESDHSIVPLNFMMARPSASNPFQGSSLGLGIGPPGSHKMGMNS